MKKLVWLIGAGYMAKEYAKVLSDIDCKINVIGRGKKNADIFEKETALKVYAGGLKNYLDSNPEKCTHAIVATGVETLYDVTKMLLNYGIKNILVEKPAGLTKFEVENIALKTKEIKANVFVAYNRRFYAAVNKALEIIKNDGGVTSFNFEFTEWAHVIAPLIKADGVKEKWFLANSTHVVDLAFFLGGFPKAIESHTSGSLPWHPTASVFSGSGISKIGALFSYQANWESAGRWSVEILTSKNRLILRPMEKLQIQKRGEIAQTFVEIDYSFDEKYKPGLFLQTKCFLDEIYDNFCSINEQNNIFPIYEKMANY